MALVRHTSRTLGQFLPNGTTPTNQFNANTFNISQGGITNFSLLRLRTDIELYVLAQGSGSANIDLRVLYETKVMMGSIAYVGGSVTTSNTPITDANLPSVTGLLGNWGQWEDLQGSVDFVDTLTPQIGLFTWRPRNGTIDTQFRRSVNSINGIDVWMPWEIQDGAGLINTTTAGVTYNLGCRFSQSLVWETRT